MEHEQTLFKDIKSLDSDMQTLVYENYNKFINATDTIKKVSDLNDLNSLLRSILDELFESFFLSNITNRWAPILI